MACSQIIQSYYIQGIDERNKQEKSQFKEVV
jgi:hypothetical protein